MNRRVIGIGLIAVVAIGVAYSQLSTTLGWGNTEEDTVMAPATMVGGGTRELVGEKHNGLVGEKINGVTTRSADK